MKTKEVSIVLTDGMDTKPNEQLAAKLKLLQNATLEKKLTPRKRHGKTPLSKVAVNPNTSPALSNIISIDNYNGGLVAEDKNGLYVHDSGQDRWTQKSSMPRSILETFTLITDNTITPEMRFYDYAELDGYRIFTMADFANVNNSILYVVDSKNNIVYDSKADIGTITGRIRPVVIGSRVAIVQITGALIDIGELYFNFPGIQLSTGILSNVLANTLPHFDVCAISSSKIAIGYYDGANLKSITINTSGAGVFTIGDSVTVDAAAINTTSFHIAWDSASSLLWFAYWQTSGINSLAGTKNYNSSLVLQNAFASAKSVVTATEVPYSLGISFPYSATAQADLYICYVPTAGGITSSTTYKSIMVSVVANAWAASSLFVLSGRLYSKPFVYNSKSNVIISRLEPSSLGSDVDLVNATYYILDSDKNVSARFMRGQADWLFGSNPDFLVTPNFASNILTFAGIGKDAFSNAANFQTIKAYANIVTVTYESLKKSKAINLAGCLFMTGANPTVFDGNIEYENGFLHSPYIFSTSVGAGGLPNGSYRYLVTYEYTNFRGQKVVSSSQEYLYSNTTNQYLNIAALSYKLGKLTGCQVVLWRTALDGDTFYKVTSIANDSTTNYVSLNDSVPDATLETRETYYFPEPVLENQPPSPFSSFDLFKNRLMTIASDKLNYVQFTKEKDFELDPGFNEFLRLLIEDNSVSVAEKLVAVSSLDDKLIFFKESTIMYSIGDGPDNSGESGEFTRPQLVSYDVGCINPRCIALTPNGLMFVSKKGIWALSRGMEIEYIGKEVEEYNNYTFSSAILDEKRNLVYFSTTDGPALAYDYFTKQWSVFDNYSGNDMTMVDDKICLGTSDGTIYQENADYDDDGNFIKQIIETNWIKMSGVQNFGRARRLLLLGEFVSKHKMKVSVAYDYEQYYQDEYVLTPEDAADYNITTKPANSDLYNGTIDGVYQWRIHLAKQKCQAIKIKIEDVEDGVDGESFRLSDLTLEVGLKDGPFKTEFNKQG